MSQKSIPLIKKGDIKMGVHPICDRKTEMYHENGNEACLEPFFFNGFKYSFVRRTNCPPSLWKRKAVTEAEETLYYAKLTVLNEKKRKRYENDFNDVCTKRKLAQKARIEEANKNSDKLIDLLQSTLI